MIAYESEGINLIRTVGHACLLMGSLDKLQVACRCFAEAKPHVVSGYPFFSFFPIASRNCSRRRAPIC